MATFTPPTSSDVPAVYVAPDAYAPVEPLAQRLFRWYGPRTRGRNVFLLTDGTVTETEPYPYVDASVQPGQPGATTVARTFYGGHSHTVNAAEAAALVAAGYTVT